jgi:hypothetical protein
MLMRDQDRVDPLAVLGSRQRHLAAHPEESLPQDRISEQPLPGELEQDGGVANEGEAI